MAKKAYTQSSFKKRKIPTFEGDVLNYYDFKKRCENEVRPERNTEPHALASLKDALPQLAKNKLSQVIKLEYAWKILDEQYGDKDN